MIPVANGTIKTNRPKSITVTTSNQYVVAADGLLCGDVLFITVRISKDIPSPAFQNIAFTLPSDGRNVIQDVANVGRSGSISFGSGSDTGKTANTRLYATSNGNCGMSFSVSQALVADCFVQFCVPYY